MSMFDDIMDGKVQTISKTPAVKGEKNLCAKTRPLDNPYEVWVSHDGTWEWRILKKWQSPSKEANNPYARWFCAVKSPMTFGGWDYGDTYVKDVIENAIKKG